MKAFQLIFACVLHLAAGSHILQGDDGPVDISQEEFCTDVSQYSPKYYEDVVETCCTTVYEPNCEWKSKKVCMDVTNTICKPFATPNYGIDSQLNPGGSGPGGDGGAPVGFGPGDDGNNGLGDGLGGPGDGNNGDGPGGDKGPGSGDGNNNNNCKGPGCGDGSGNNKNTQCDLATDSVDMHDCKPKEVVFKHIKLVPHCEPVTSLNCETGWKVVNGKKVWSGEEECEEVTWDDCKLVEKEVDFPAVESDCKPAAIPQEDYVTAVNTTVNVRVSVPKFTIVQGTKCEPVTTNECVTVPYQDCSKPVRKEQCRNFNVRKPKQDFIHKKKCLLPQDIERLTGGRNL